MLISNVKRLIIFFLLILFCLPGGLAQEHRINQKKINKERERKQKMAEKEYRNGVKKHKKSQSKNTKAMMQRSRKESGSLTPVKR